MLQVHAQQEYEKNKTKLLKSLRKYKENRESWYEKDVKELNINETNHLICALQEMKAKLISEISPYPQLNVYQNYLGESCSHIPLFGYNNNRVVIRRSNMNYMSGFYFNQS